MRDRESKSAEESAYVSSTGRDYPLSLARFDTQTHVQISVDVDDPERKKVKSASYVPHIKGEERKDD